MTLGSGVETVREQQGLVTLLGKGSWEKVTAAEISQCPLRQSSPTAPELGRQGRDRSRSYQQSRDHQVKTRGSVQSEVSLGKPNNSL